MLARRLGISGAVPVETSVGVGCARSVSGEGHVEPKIVFGSLYFNAVRDSTTRQRSIPSANLCLLPSRARANSAVRFDAACL